MQITQRLSSGITIRQNISDAIRFVFFDSSDDNWKYFSNGGTAFLEIIRVIYMLLLLGMYLTELILNRICQSLLKQKFLNREVI